MGLVAPALFGRPVRAHPELLHVLPFEVFAASSIDAARPRRRVPALFAEGDGISKLLSYKAAEMIIRHYETIAHEGREARIPLLGDFLLASNYAGIAFGTAGCAAVHALSYPLGRRLPRPARRKQLRRIHRRHEKLSRNQIRRRNLGK